MKTSGIPARIVVSSDSPTTSNRLTGDQHLLTDGDAERGIEHDLARTGDRATVGERRLAEAAGRVPDHHDLLVRPVVSEARPGGDDRCLDLGVEGVDRPAWGAMTTR